MARPVTPLGSLGAKVAASLDDDAGKRDEAIEEARRQFLTHTIHRPLGGRRVGRQLALAMAAALSLAVVAWLFIVRTTGRLQFTVDGGAGLAQTWLAAPQARPLVVQFSDGTVVRVEPLSRARVVDTDRYGASIALESGQLSAEVVHTSQSAWRLIAGPFAVRVTGTRFDLHWDSASQKFSIAVREGSVGVAGSIVGAERPVRAGETLVASVTEGRLDLVNDTSARLPTPADEGEGAQAVDRPAPPGESGAVAAASPAAGAAVSPEMAAKDLSPGGWRDFAKSGDLRQAFSIAEARGFQSVCETATPAELLVLGDAARLSGRADRASEALLTLRRKYPHDSRRAAAAFALGKVAFDQRHAYAQAAEWFATCVREQPSGPLAREAWGRRIEALRNAGDSSGAQRAARDYLSRYPDGPHADIARSVLK